MIIKQVLLNKQTNQKYIILPKDKSEDLKPGDYVSIQKITGVTNG